MKFIVPLFFLFIMVSSVLAFDCTTLDNEDECNLLKSTNEDIIANLIYTSTESPDHSFIRAYNSNINIDNAPDDTSYHYTGVIKSAWFDIFTIMPSILYKNKTLIPSTIQVRSDYDYEIDIPTNVYENNYCNGCLCQLRYSLQSENAQVNFYANTTPVSTTKTFWVGLSRDTLIKGILDISATYKTDRYEWDKYCCSRRNGKCRKYCYRCEHDLSWSTTNSLRLEDSEQVYAYQHFPQASFQYVSQTQGSTKGNLTADNETELRLTFPSSYYEQKLYDYSAVFLKKPYYFLQIKAEDNPTQEYRNLLKSEDYFYVKEASSCSLEVSDFFKTNNFSCSMNHTGEEIESFEKKSFSKSWNLLFMIIIFLFINFIIFRILKKTWGKTLLPIIFIVLLSPVAFAEDECGLTNLASCIPEKMYDFFIDLLNAPLQPLLNLTRSLMETAPSTDLFIGVWAIMVYIASLFYGFLFMYSGFQFLFSGHNVIRREMAKEWLKNTVIMITLIQGSCYIYGLVLEVGAILTSSVLSMVNETFFLITADNIVNIGLEFLFLSFYVITLFITILLLLIRYLIVAFGVIFAPLGIFCYFIPPLRSYGKLILHLLGSFIFITFIDAIIILACSMMIEIPLFANIKILVMIACFTTINAIFFMMIIKAIFKAVFSSGGGGQDIAQAVKYIAMLA